MDLDISRKRVLLPTNFTKKWSARVQASFLEQVGELLQEGFTLQETLDFIALLLPAKSREIEQLMVDLEKGECFEIELRKFGFSEMICSQLYLARKHGSFLNSCVVIAGYLKQKDRQMKKLRHVIFYPCLLVAILITMMSVLRFLLLEQLSSMIQEATLRQYPLLHLVWQSFVYFPQLTIGVIGLIFIIGTGIYVYWRAKSPIKKIQLLEKIPILNHLIRQYYTFVYAREFSYFLENGESLLQMIDDMKSKEMSKLTKSIAEVLDKSLQKGNSFSSALRQVGIFQERLIFLIVEGELTNQLGVKLQQLSKNVFEEFKQSLERKIIMVQPILFIGIGLMIVAMYLILLLPTLTMIGEI